MNIYDFTAKDAKGNDIKLSEYKGKTLLVVNTATGCGFTPQYSGLQDLYEKYKDKGFEILDFPCNQFANQTPGTDEEIGSFCTGRFGITFKQFAKINVNGEDESSLFKWLKEQKGGMGGANIKWNFTKFLINKDGEVVGRYAPTKTPAALDKEIEKLLDGFTVEQTEDKLSGILCGRRGTSCSDQLSIAVRKTYDKAVKGATDNGV